MQLGCTVCGEAGGGACFGGAGWGRAHRAGGEGAQRGVKVSGHLCAAAPRCVKGRQG